MSNIYDITNNTSLLPPVHPTLTINGLSLNTHLLYYSFLFTLAPLIALPRPRSATAAARPRSCIDSDPDCLALMLTTASWKRGRTILFPHDTCAIVFLLLSAGDASRRSGTAPAED